MFGAEAFLVALLVAGERKNDPETRWQIALAAAIAAMLVAAAAMRLLGVGGAEASGGRGAIVGALTGLLAHPLTWYLVIVWNYCIGTVDSLRQPPINPIQAIFGSLVLSFWSLLLLGWLTVPMAAATGWFLHHVRVTEAGSSLRIP